MGKYARQPNNLRSQSQRKPPDLPVHQRQFQPLQRAGILTIRFSDVLRHAHLRETALERREEARCSGEIGEDEYGDYCYAHCCCAFDEEEPAPGSEAKYALHAVKDGGGDERTERVADDAATEEESCAEPHLPAFVPFAEKEERPWEEGSFEDTQ